jgi:hypothetical protein
MVGIPQRPEEGIPVTRTSFLVPQDEWTAFAAAAKELDMDRAALLRRFIKWCNGNGPLPERPVRPRRQVTGSRAA